MSHLHIYLLKVSLGLSLIAIPYYFLLRNDPNLVLKRFYLSLGVLLSWIFPLLNFGRPDLVASLTPTVFIDPGTVAPAVLNHQAGDPSEWIIIDWIRILFIIYLSGLTFMLLKNLYIIIRWNLDWKRNRGENDIVYTQSGQVFTLFTRIFIPGSLEGKADLENILLHERAHVRQLHFVDLILMELTLLLTWFNPFSWLISRMIKENHEHLADRQVLAAGVNPAHYRAQLLNYTLGVNVFRLGNQFNHSLTLNRFKMMKKPENSLPGVLKLVMLVPAVLVIMGLTTGMTPRVQETVKGTVIFAESGEPAPGASVIIAGSTTGTVTDEHGAFSLNVEGNPDIVISFVGYANILVPASKIGTTPLKLENQVFELNLDDVPEPVKQKVVEQEEVPEIPTDQSGDEVFFIIEDMPMFPGGKAALKDYIYTHLVYPEKAKEEGITGKVLVQFDVTGKGKLQDIHVVRGVHEELDRSAVEVFRSMPDWTPGRQRGKAVEVQVVVPVSFILWEK
jgi:TonB family protein